MDFGHKLDGQLSSADFLRIEENPLPGFLHDFNHSAIGLLSLSHMQCIVWSWAANNGVICQLAAD